MNTRHILPGYSFNLKKNSFRKKIYHKFKNGFPVIERDYPPLEPDELEAVPSKIQIDPVLIYGILKKPKLPTCVPKCIKYHGITLSFKGCIVPSNVSNLVEEIINRDIDNIRHECTDMLQESIDEEKENEFIHKNTNNENNQIQKNHTNNNGILALASKELISSITGKLSNANNETKKLVHGTKNLKDDNTQPLCSEDLKGTHDHEKNSLNERKDLFGNNKDFPDNCSTQTALVKETMDSRYDSQANNNESNEPCFSEKESYGEDIFRSETNMIKNSDTVRGAHDKKEREVILTYYLEDDSIEIKEKILDTSQYVTIARRGRLYKKDCGIELKDYYSWKALNVGIDIYTNDFKIHIVSCDNFTRGFFKKQSINLNEDETVFEPEHSSHRVQYKVTLGGINVSSEITH